MTGEFRIIDRWRFVVFKRPNGGHVEISQEAVEIMLQYRQLSGSSTEAGGILLGRLILGNSDVVLDEAMPPSRSDRRLRSHFWRALGIAQRRVRLAWRESKGTRVYLGEWHTHPEDCPRVPSTLDLEEWGRLLRETKGEHDSLFFVIVGREDVRAWEGDVRTGTITPLESR